MNYEAFKSAFHAALRASGLPLLGFSEEKLDLRHLDRTYEVGFEPVGGQDVEPWFVSGKASFTWRALHTARTASIEEDVLTELCGSEDAYTMDTRQSVLRLDIEMQANLPWGKAIPMPKPAVWAKWADEVLSRLEDIEPVVPEEAAREMDDGRLEILAWQGEPVARVAITAGGELRLESIKVAAFELIRLQRIWDDSEREPDPHPHDQLVALFKRVKASIHAWKDGIDHLVPGTKRK